MMRITRVAGGECVQPFPVYRQLVDTLVAAHRAPVAERDRTVAHVLGTGAGYAYADQDTMSMMMTRLGLERHACVAVTQVVDAMFIFSTAYLLQSQCGRVVILCYRGTVPHQLGNWLGDFEVGSGTSRLALEDGAASVRVHAGFLLNLRATWLPVIEELKMALAGRFLLDHDRAVAHPAEAVYIAGHSLGGAMAVLFALIVGTDREFRWLAERLGAVYTFGQPMAIAGAVPPSATAMQATLFRHVLPRDPVPCLPPAAWGPFVHIGHEYRYDGEGWERAGSPVRQLTSVGQIPRSLIALFANDRQRSRFRFSATEHAPHHYVDALRPRDRVSEFGDQAEVVGIARASISTVGNAS